MVVQTRNAKKEVTQSVVEATANIAGGSSFNVAPPLPSPRPESTCSRSTKSSATVRAKILLAEAQYARRVAEMQKLELQTKLELQKRQAQIERQQVHIEQRTVEIEHRAQLAVLEAEGSECGSRHSSRSRHSHHSDVHEERRVRSWLNDIHREASPAIGQPSQETVALGTDPGQNNTFTYVQVRETVLSSPVAAKGAADAAPTQHQLAAPESAVAAAVAATPIGAIET